MNDYSIKDFFDFIEEQPKKPTQAELRLAKLAWNKAISTASGYFGECEGVDYGAEKRLTLVT